VLSGSYDATLRMHGLKSGKTLKIFRGHTSYVNDCAFTIENSRALSASSDATVKVWDVKTTECLQTIKPAGQLKEIAVQSIFILPKNTEQVVVCTRSPVVHIMTLKGQIVKSFTATKKDTVASGAAVDKPVDIMCCCLSPRGNYLYCATEDSNIYCFDTQTGNIESIFKGHDKTTIGMHHHPHRNLLATYSDDGSLKLWKP